MIHLNETESTSFVSLFDFTKPTSDEQDLQLTMVVCNDVFCDCGNVDLVAKHRGHIEPHFSVPLNVFGWKVCPDDTVVETNVEQYKDYENRFKEELTEAHWSLLRKKYYQHKHVHIQEAKPEDTIVTFPIEQLESRGLMMNLDDLFPAASFTVYHEGIEYLLFDAYCKNDACKCGDIAIEIVKVGDKEFESLNTYLYNYIKKEGEFESSANTQEVEQVINAFKAEQPRLDEMLRKRNKLMRQLYKPARIKYEEEQEIWTQEIAKRAAATPPSPKKIGRNDPCPCGSGKKYKKCCLNSGSGL